MKIQFIYVQKKVDKTDYLIAVKTKNINENLNKQIYKLLYNDINNDNINYITHFYTKKGMNIPFNQELWEDLMKTMLNEQHISTLIGYQNIYSLYTSNIIQLDYLKNKEKINKILLTTFKLKMEETMNITG